MSQINVGRLIAVIRKELRVYRRTRAILVTMLVLPMVFLIEPLAIIFGVSAHANGPTVEKLVSSVFLLLLITPAMLPSVVAAYSVVGEREQGTLEPLLTTPLSREELLLGKALSAMIPAIAIGYVVFVLIEISAQVFAPNHLVAVDLAEGPKILAQLIFTPLLAGWSSWVAIGISARSSDTRVAQQLATLASTPPLLYAALLAYNVIAPSLRVAIISGAVLLAANGMLWRIVSAMFDRERLIIGAKAQPFIANLSE